MAFTLDIAVDPAGLPIPAPLAVTVTALGQDHALRLEPVGDGLLGSLELPTAPRYLRLQASCVPDGPQDGCLDRVVFLHDTGHDALSFVAHAGEGRVLLLQDYPGGAPVGLQFGWGVGLLSMLGLLWLRVGSRARP
jgi:hypothetical protein